MSVDKATRDKRDPTNTIRKATKGWRKLETKDGYTVYYGGSPARQEQTAKDDAEAKENRKKYRKRKK